MPTQSSGYYSSEDKDILREYFDLPMLRQLYQRKGEPLSYFGLPGAEALDIRAWRECIGEVGAVERKRSDLERLEQVLETRYPEIRFKTHFGEIDKVILANRGKNRIVGGEPYRPDAGNHYETSVNNNVWRFDVVYLDYFGTFLPAGPGGVSKRARERTSALSKLFDRDRVDAWQPWILIITVEAQLYNLAARDTLRQYLSDTQVDASDDTRQALAFLLSNASTRLEEGVRLIHGATALLVADSTKPNRVMAKPRGTVMYSGANDTPMVHMAFEFQPNAEVLSGTSDRLPLLLAPILRPKSPCGAPWVELLPEQCSGVTRDTASQCLDFLELQVVVEIVSSLG